LLLKVCFQEEIGVVTPISAAAILYALCVGDFAPFTRVKEKSSFC
jgi:hypothetical protein